jgi:hypothetical protein
VATLVTALLSPFALLIAGLAVLIIAADAETLSPEIAAKPSTVPANSAAR